MEPIWRKLNLMQILNRRDNTVWKIKNFSAAQILLEIVEKFEPLTAILRLKIDRNWVHVKIWVMVKFLVFYTVKGQQTTNGGLY